MPAKKNKTALVWIFIIVLLVVVGYFFYQHREAKAPVAGSAENVAQSQQSSSPTITPAATPTPTPTAALLNLNNGKTPKGTFSAGEGDGASPDIAVVEVGFDGSKFTPSPVNIKVNDWVFFKNNSTVDFWPASNPHPTHTDYPGFDALKNIAPGGEYKFQFTKAGSWGYHDHLDPSIGGMIVVSAK